MEEHISDDEGYCVVDGEDWPCKSVQADGAEEEQ